MPTTDNDATPPTTTEVTVPRSRAATPDSKAPSSFEDPMKMAFTEETRPSRCSGVSTCNKVERTTTLTLSAMPLIASKASETPKLLDSPNPMMQMARSEEHTSELQSHVNLVCRLLLEKKNK